MKKSSLWMKMLAWGNVLAFVAVVVVNYLAVKLPIGGMSTGALADLYPNLFVPAGLTFSIWGLIYFMLAGYLVWQIVDAYRKKTKGFVQQIGVWFLLSCLANILWIFAWHYQIVWLSVLVIIAFLVIQIILANKVKIGHKIGSWRDKLFIQVPFSLYVGWLSVATIANITSWLVNIGWSMRGMSDVFWTCIVIVVATVLALVSLWKKFDIIYAAVIVRAFLGILLKRIAIDPVYAMPILWTLGISMFVLSLGIGYRFSLWKKN